MNITDRQLSAIKEKEITILKEFIRVCDKYSLKWFLAYGSCLGAVRHGGFIPWDDDIDVLMPLSDYRRFLEVAPSELTENFFLQTSKTDPDYPHCFAKIRRSDTTFIESPVKNINMNHGIYMDIFPLTEIKPSIITDLKIFFYDCNIGSVYNINRAKNIKTLIRRILGSFIKDYRRARDLKDKLFSEAERKGSGTVRSFCGPWEKKEIMPSSFFNTTSTAFFEGITVNIPGEYDKYLRALYNDYTVLPPEESRVAHHYCDIIDTEKSYTEYIKRG